MVVQSFILSRSPSWKDEGLFFYGQIISSFQLQTSFVFLGLMGPRHFKELRTDILFSGCVCLCLSVCVYVCVGAVLIRNQPLNIQESVFLLPVTVLSI